MRNSAESFPYPLFCARISTRAFTMEKRGGPPAHRPPPNARGDGPRAFGAYATIRVPDLPSMASAAFSRLVMMALPSG